MRIEEPTSPATGLFPFAGLLQLFDFALDQIALERAQMVDEKNSVQVIDLVQQGAREQIFAGDFEGFAFDVLGAHGGFLGAAHRLAKTGDAEAALLAGLLAFLRDDFGIDENDAFAVPRLPRPPAISITVMRLPISICGAARPMP